MPLLPLRPEIRHALERCQETHQACLEGVAHSMLVNREREPAHIQMLMDCADITQTAANFMMRGSDLQGWVSRVCAEICIRCSRDCERFEEDGELQACAALCMRCAEACYKVTDLLPVAL